MSATLLIDQLRVGMFIHLDLGWWAHPFALSSFAIASDEQIATIRSLGVKQLRWSPEKSALADEAPAAATGAVADTELGLGTAPAAEAARADAAPAPGVRSAIDLQHQALVASRQAALAAQRVADALCARQYGEAGQAWKTAAALMREQPQKAREATEGLTQSLLSKMMTDEEMCVRVLSDELGHTLGDVAAAHALNVAVISMLVGRVMGLSASDMQDVGVGALLHDIGKQNLPQRVHHPDVNFTPADHAQYRDHVAQGVVQGKRMGLGSGALLVIAQHHEMADASGFPLRLTGDRMVMAARIVALVNRYDKLCNPANPMQSLTPHEALSMIFAQSRNKFDASLLNAFIRMMGVYPPGSYVQLTDDRYAAVHSVNSSRPLKPRVLVCDPEVPIEQALLINLEHEASLGVRRSLRPVQLPEQVQSYLSPRQRVVYFFEPVRARSIDQDQDALAMARP